jgi:hypothetical protein
MKLSGALGWLALPLLATALVQPAPGRADGAIAIAQPSDVVADGWAYGTAYNFDSREEARRAALDRCRQTKSEKRRQLCKVVQSFKHECVAVAMDPKDGTPGVGWAVEETQEAAEEKAMAECRATAGNRAQYCKLSNSGCDTK